MTNGHRHFGEAAGTPEPVTLSLSDLMRGVVERDWFMCIRCGVNLAAGPRSVHHRVLGNRKVNEPWNLITLCGNGTTGCHAWVHGVAVAGMAKPDRAEVLATGLIVSRHHPAPWEIPVLYNQPGRLGYHLLDQDLSLTPTA